MAKKKPAVATVHVSLTSYGKAAYRYQQASTRASLCQHLLGEEAQRYRADGDKQCNAYAKFELEGMPVCGKHASYILLQAAYRAALKRD